MTKRRIKNVSELPEWFKLEKYQDAIKLTAQDWYTQLIVRKYYLENPGLDYFKEPISVLRNKPLISIHDHDIFVSWFCAASKLNVNPYKPADTSFGVNSLTMVDYFEIKKNIIPQRETFDCSLLLSLIGNAMEHVKIEKLDEQNFFIKGLDGLDEATKQVQDYESWLNLPVSASSYPNSIAENVATINLNYTDEILIEHFKRWLSQMRSAKQQELKSKYYYQNNYNDWVQYGVLPYLDLKGWEMENNIQIPNRVMADAIYPTGEGGEETVRKTTKPLVSKLLSEKTLSQLVGQITLEIPEKKSL